MHNRPPIAFVVFVLSFPSASAASEREELMKRIESLVGQTVHNPSPSSNSSSQSFSLAQADDGITITLKQPDPAGAVHTLRYKLPGAYKFSVTSGSTGKLVVAHAALNILGEVRTAQELWTLGLYDDATATALVNALTRLNQLAVSATFEAYEQWPMQGVYDDKYLVSVEMDAGGIRYQPPNSIRKGLPLSWDDVTSWEAREMSKGDFAIIVKHKAQPRPYSTITFRTHKSQDYLSAIKSLRFYASTRGQAYD